MAERLFKWGEALKIYDCDPYMTDYLYTHRVKSTEEQWNETISQLSESQWVYVGHLQYHISEHMLYSYFSCIGNVEEIVFGVNANDHKQKIGFAFIKYLSHSEACSAVDCLNNTILLNKSLRVQLDPGFEDGRQFGRGKSGHQRYKEKERTLKKIEKKLNAKKFKKIQNQKNINEITQLLSDAKFKFDQNEEEKEKKNNDDNDDDDEEDEDEDIDLNVNDKKEKKEEKEEKKEEKEEKKDDIVKGSEFDIILPQTKKRKLDPNIARKLQIASQQIDEENWENRMKNYHKHDEDMDDIMNMMGNTLRNDENMNNNDNNGNNERIDDGIKDNKCNWNGRGRGRGTGRGRNGYRGRGRGNNRGYRGRWRGRGRGRGRWRGRGGRGRMNGMRKKYVAKRSNNGNDSRFDSMLETYTKFINKRCDGVMKKGGNENNGGEQEKCNKNDGEMNVSHNTNNSVMLMETD